MSEGFRLDGIGRERQSKRGPRLVVDDVRTSEIRLDWHRTNHSSAHRTLSMDDSDDIIWPEPTQREASTDGASSLRTHRRDRWDEMGAGEIQAAQARKQA
ncbi:hypothetical protein [Phaffia rhodozyma]|uniref:Uncharacterized protein n=1 Tax=Phaffia rhodozyma TaxID=264483 RepID=A0A0F7SW71_PHARH|nr:hypothetical protein [Phaffia rhodozyma]